MDFSFTLLNFYIFILKKSLNQFKNSLCTPIVAQQWRTHFRTPKLWSIVTNSLCGKTVYDVINHNSLPLFVLWVICLCDLVWHFISNLSHKLYCFACNAKSSVQMEDPFMGVCGLGTESLFCVDGFVVNRFLLPYAENLNSS